MEREMDINGPYHYTDPWTNDKIAPYTNNILNKGNKKKGIGLLGIKTKVLLRSDMPQPADCHYQRN